MEITDLLINANEPDTKPKKITKKKDKGLDAPKKTAKTVSTDIGHQPLNDELFMKLITETYKKRSERSLTYEKSMLSVTDLCGFCPRKPYFRLMNASFELIMYPYSDLIMHVGNAIHEWIQQLLRNVYTQVSTEYKIEVNDDDLKLKGFIDVVYKTKSNQIVLLEIKSCGNEIHQENFRGKVVHWRQLAFYYYLWTKKLKKSCSKVQLMYVKRDFKPDANYTQKQPFKILTVDQPEKLWEAYGKDLLWMYETVTKAFKKQQVPTIPKERYQIIVKEECGFCPYQKICSKHTISNLDETKLEILF
jgi:CRISPR/Cas system-associated exonuclease Cas4 (RecB family)